MKPLVWNEAKNTWLQSQRGISFEDVVNAINTGGLIAEMKHPNEIRYSNQYVMIVKLKGYVYVIPYVEDGEKRFLKTAYPSRKVKKFIESKGGAYEKN
jgi:uncharacterized DUF497 family protein